MQAGSGVPVLGDLRHSGCLKALFPRGRTDRLGAVIVNTSGGITGGDRLRIEARAAPGSRLSLTSQAAERIYRAEAGEAGHVSTRLHVAENARLDWLPQETILYDHAALDRHLRVDLEGSARCLLLEALVFGRIAMGEELHHLDLSDRIEIWRDGALLFIDRLRLRGDTAARLERSAIGGGARAMASVILATSAAEAEAHLAALRPLLPDGAGVSLIRPGLLFLRLMAPDSYLLRRMLLPVLARLDDAPLPRTWML